MQDDLTPELKPCANCDSTDIWVGLYSGAAMIRCACGISIGGEESDLTADECARRWNTRATSPGAAPADAAIVKEAMKLHDVASRRFFRALQGGDFDANKAAHIEAEDALRAYLSTHLRAAPAAQQAASPSLLAECLERIEADWRRIDDEWGPSDGGLEGEIARGHETLIPKLRAAQQAAGGWIRVAERLPADGQAVAFVVDCKGPGWEYLHGRVLGGTYRRGTGFSTPGLGVIASAWQPLPAPPAAPLQGQKG